MSCTSGTTAEFTFTSFDTETWYDFVYLYDGNTTSADQFPGSPFSGSSNP